MFLLYLPMDDNPELVDEIIGLLYEWLPTVPQISHLTLMLDLNGQVNQTYETNENTWNVVGHLGKESTTANGAKLINVCRAFGFQILSTFWDGGATYIPFSHQIDFICQGLKRNRTTTSCKGRTGLRL